MPSKPIIMKDPLDRFYTKDIVAINCINILNRYVNDSDIFVEPSAGGGAFYRHLVGNKVGIDLSPSCDGVVQADWFYYNIPKDCVVIGNPPCGTRNRLSKRFINKACTKAKVVAFILPSSFRKETMQRIFTAEWNLVDVWDLPKDSFLLDGKSYHIPCVFQVWIKNTSLPDLRESAKEVVMTNYFYFTDRSTATHFIFGTSPQKIIKKELVQQSNRGYYLCIKDESVLEDFKHIDWKSFANSSVCRGVAWYSKQEIINNFETFKAMKIT